MATVNMASSITGCRNGFFAASKSVTDGTPGAGQPSTRRNDALLIMRHGAVLFGRKFNEGPFRNVPGFCVVKQHYCVLTASRRFTTNFEIVSQACGRVILIKCQGLEGFSFVKVIKLTLITNTCE